ncbi:MAG: peptidogalycan biosysnthesis protein [Spirochaetota bacterium]
MADLTFTFAPTMTSIDRTEWDALAAPYGTPFYFWGFLALLEESGSVVPENGWTPLHLLARRDGRLVAAAPLYAKTASWGEFVYDFQFASVAKANNIPWYPKLVGIIPLTPAPLWRVLVAAGEDEGAISGLFLDAALEAARASDFGGFHVLWPAPEMAALIRSRQASGANGRFAAWEHQTFLWTDSGYRDFGGYLAAFSKNMRRNVLRERSGLDASGLSRRMIEAGEAASVPGLLARMADFYESTNDKFGPWAAKFLTRDFFLRLPEFLPEGWVLGAAFDGEADSASAKDPLGLSFLLKGDRGLWGRYWGSSRFEAGLHFELCYYLPIEWALSKGLAFFDPGIGSEHKARRGFQSVLAPSFHRVFDPRLARAVERSLAEANRAEEAGIRALNEELPFKISQLP